MKKFLLAGASIALAGCMNSYPIATDQATPIPAQYVYAPAAMLQPCAGCGTLIVSRDRSGGANHGRMHIELDGSRVADCWPGQKLVLYLPAGRHILSAYYVHWAQIATVEADVVAGETRVYQIGMTNGGGASALIVIRPALH